MGKLFVNSPEKFGILYTLSYLYQYGIDTSIPLELLEIDTSSTKFRTAQVVMRLAHWQKPILDWKWMAIELAELAEDQEEAADTVFDEGLLHCNVKSSRQDRRLIETQKYSA
jgi:hypothetical protein